MATATVSRGTPTEAEMRAALERRFETGDSYASDMEFVDYLSDGFLQIWQEPIDPATGDGMGHSPILAAMIAEAMPAIEARIKQIAINGLTEVGLRFAAAYPDAARKVAAA